ncbi:hypothetical protein D9615_001865 [Tricholomella constricta]|uniref:GDS1 winged helix domain-containing protein n=1 Tax=Tricholomella constricta TaxID=117010 RepID=A0A8H5MAR1_9AGAR|nr:hypothetical protein D9615_001865 [Tricholomella constricta]
MDQPQHSSSPLSLPDPRINHSYGTRIRQNILIKPSLRLRQSPDPQPQQQRKPKPAHPLKSAPPPSSQHSFPQFPPPGIVLHPDDATSKVFLAIGRSFLSVDNRAMTIKDLAEMTVTFGLVCQNVSAASQAITTYIRTHMQRCEVQQDQPLLLRHTLSGTASDDDLLPALHSRSGGAHCNIHPENRVTNFRRGTMVWYMSRTTGAPCPFTRAGIRLCDYGEDGKAGNLTSSKEKKRQRERERQAEQCGSKRKRPLRGCTARGTESDIDEEQPPPKVKLTLRLKPLHCRSTSTSTSMTTDHSSSTSNRTIDMSKDSDSDSESSDDDSMSVDSSSSEVDEAPSPPQPSVEEQPWSLPPYPRKSISIPCYTPCNDAPYPHVPWSSADVDPYRRSPSVPYSIGSLPPDSEDEDDDYHITMTGARRHSTAPRSSVDDPDGWDADLDSEGDGDIGESPGPRSPSAPVMLPEVSVKEEPTDVQGIVAAWDDFDDSLAGAKVAEVIAQAAASVLVNETANIKTESFDNWSWESGYTDPTQRWSLGAEGELTARVKQEDIDLDSSFYPPSLHIDFGLSSPQSPLSQLPGLSYSDSPSPEGSREPTEWNDDQFATLRPRTKIQPNYFNGPSPPPTSFSLPLTPQREPSGPSRPELVLAPTPTTSHSLASLIRSMSMNSPTAVAPSSLLALPSCISPHETRGNPSDVVVVHTCHPCTPAISATQIEGISVYQTMLGSFQLLRRIDTDFVNLSPIVAYSGAPWPVLSTIPKATSVTKGSPVVSGTWVPLSAAQAYVRDHQRLQNGPLKTFLSDNLFERFPSALQDFHHSSKQGRMLGHFGPHFGSTLQATQLCGSAETQTLGKAWESREESAPPSGAFTLSMALSSPDRSAEEADLPLSATEQEIFHALCDIPDWDKENSPPSSPMLVEQKIVIAVPGGAQSLDAESSTKQGQALVPPAPDSERADRPLRRSKRVADAIAAQTQTRTRSRRGGSRNSLS